MRFEIAPGSTSVIRHVRIRDSVTGAAKTALVYSDMTAKYVKDGGSLTSLTMETIATLGIWASSGAAYLGFKKLDDTNMPGWYEIDLPNNLLATAGRVSLELRATGAEACALDIELRDTATGTALAAVPTEQPTYYRAAIEITNSGSPVTDQVFYLPVAYRAGMATDFSDVWFSTAAGEPIDYWLDAYTASERGHFYIAQASVPAGTTTVYVLWGNQAIRPAPNGHEVFTHFEDVERDSLTTWKADAANPVKTDGSFCSVLKIADTYYMYFSSNGAGGGGSHDINRATSPDGITWTNTHTPVMHASETWEGGATGDVWDGQVWYEGGSWHMIYCARHLSGSMAIGYATSADGITWTKYASNPILVAGAGGTWDETGPENFGLMKDGSTYYLWYNTLYGSGRESGLATATTLTGPWTKHASNPIFGTDFYQPQPFKWQGYYYLLILHYTYGGISDLCLYRDTSPTFLEGSRELVRVVARCVPGGWSQSSLDCPALLTDDITRDSFPDGRIRVYASGSEGGVWKTGLWYGHPATDLEVVPEILMRSAQTDGWDVHAVTTVCRSNAHAYQMVGGSQNWDTTNEILIDEDATIELWMRSDGATTSYFEIYFYESYSTLRIGMGMTLTAGPTVQAHYWNGSRQTVVTLVNATWYLFRLIWHQSAKTFDFVVLDTNYNEVIRKEGLSTSVSAHIDRLGVNTSGTYNGTAYFDDFRVRPTTSALPLRVAREKIADVPAVGARAKYAQAAIDIIDPNVAAIKAVTDTLSTTTIANAVGTHTTDGVSYDSLLKCVLAAIGGVAVVSGSDVLFKARDGNTTVLTVTVGTTAGQRTASVIA